MTVYIDMYDALKEFKPDEWGTPDEKWWPENEVAAYLIAIPAADVRPVARGEWIGYPECLKYPNAYSDDHIVCAACEECFSILDNDCERFNFCPNCGAEMREGAR